MQLVLVSGLDLDEEQLAKLEKVLTSAQFEHIETFIEAGYIEWCEMELEDILTALKVATMTLDHEIVILEDRTMNEAIRYTTDPKCNRLYLAKVVFKGGQGYYYKATDFVFSEPTKI